MSEDNEFRCMTLNLKKIFEHDEYGSFAKAMSGYLYFNEAINAGDFFQKMGYWDLLQITETYENMIDKNDNTNQAKEEFMLLVMLCARGESLTFISYEEVLNALKVFKKYLGIRYAHVTKRIKNVNYSKFTLEMSSDYDFESLYEELP